MYIYIYITSFDEEEIIIIYLINYLVSSTYSKPQLQGNSGVISEIIIKRLASACDRHLSIIAN